MNPKQIFLKFHPFLFIASFLLMSFFIWQGKQPQAILVDKKTPVPTPATNQLPPGFQLIYDSCNQDECLFIKGGTWLGISTIKGYYTAITKSPWGIEENCDDFVITGGSERTAGFFIDLVKGGNTVNSVNDNNQPVVNINIVNLDNVDKQKLLNSSKEEPVELVVLFPKPERESGAPACFSFVEILKVKS